jgi:hypothetical protein
VYDEKTIKSLFVQLMRDNPSMSVVYKLDFSKEKGTLGISDSGKPSRQVECRMIAFETIGRQVREAFEEVHGKSEPGTSTMRLEEFQANHARLILHPYWKLGIFEISVRKT